MGGDGRVVITSSRWAMKLKWICWSPVCWCSLWNRCWVAEQIWPRLRSVRAHRELIVQQPLSTLMSLIRDLHPCSCHSLT